MAISGNSVRELYNEFVAKCASEIEVEIDAHFTRDPSTGYEFRLRVSPDKERLETVIDDRVCSVLKAPGYIGWTERVVLAICNELVVRYRASGWTIWPLFAGGQDGSVTTIWCFEYEV